MKPTALLALVLLPACSKSEAKKPDETQEQAPATEVRTTEPAPAPADKPAQTPEELVKQMNAAIEALMKRAEHGASEVQVQHILIGVTHPRLTGVQRSPGEAQELAAQLYGRIQAGEDFDTLVKNYTNDSHPGIYTLVVSGGDRQSSWNRGEMARAFGDVGWRLEVGEVGVAPYDGGIPGVEPKSPFGFHLIKRLK
jgi:hypothetical protein